MYAVNGNNLLPDTIIIIYALKGLANVKPYFNFDTFISVITEIEILVVKNINIKGTVAGFCITIPLTNKKQSNLTKRKVNFHYKMRLLQLILPEVK